MPEYYMNCGY